MRSHMINRASPTSDHGQDQLVVKNDDDDHLNGGYRPRENRKKTWSDHSEKERVLSNTNNEDVDDNDNINNDESVVDDPCARRCSQSKNEESTVAPPPMNLPRRANRRSSRYNDMGNATNSSSVSEIDQLEQEEVALSLIMLSMDVGQWGDSSSTHNSTAADSNTLFLDPEKRAIVGKGKSRAFSNEVEYTKMIMSSTAKAMKCESMDSEFFYYEGSEKLELSASGYLSNESKINKLEGSDHGYARYDQENGQKLKFGDNIEVQLSKGLRNNNVLFRGELDATKSDEWKRKISEICNESVHLSKSASGSKRSRFECGTCSKVFHSYQALGGHRASHKKIKGCSSSSLKHEIINNSIEIQPIGDRSLDGSKKGRKHECSICFKMFLSGQALGGHKRSHQIALSSDQATTINQQSVMIQIPTPEIREFIDLNLPKPVEEEPTTAYGEFKSWRSFKQEFLTLIQIFCKLNSSASLVVHLRQKVESLDSLDFERSVDEM
ncbi:Zinc finger protein ZAT4-like protein [Drosera capensis]